MMAKLAHIQILIKKLDSMSDEEFHTYWTEEHPKVWLGVAVVKEKVVKYTQVCIPLCPSPYYILLCEVVWWRCPLMMGGANESNQWQG